MPGFELTSLNFGSHFVTTRPMTCSTKLFSSLFTAIWQLNEDFFCLFCRSLRKLIGCTYCLHVMYLFISLNRPRIPPLRGPFVTTRPTLLLILQQNEDGIGFENDKKFFKILVLSLSVCIAKVSNATYS